MEFVKLYTNKYKNILYVISWFNKNRGFDKSIGRFKKLDFFTFLENIYQFDYRKDIFYDDIYYIFEYTNDSILHLINNINKEIKREHKIVPISQAKEFDNKTTLWLSRQDGRTLKEKLKNNKIQSVKRYKNIDTYENRVFKLFLKKLLLILETRKNTDNDYLISKIRKWLRSEDAKNINEYGKIVYNNILLHHPHYNKIFKSYKWLNRLEEKVNTYFNSYLQKLKTIIKFEILTQLQFSTKDVKLLPNDLNDNFNLVIKNPIIDIEIDKYLSQIKDEITQQLNFQSIRSFAKYIINNSIKLDTSIDKFFNLENISENPIYIDLFRLFPIARIGNKTIKLPITLLQELKNNIINANNTNIINLNYENYTLPEILKTYNIEIMSKFLDNLQKTFNKVQLNYIIPDYVNIFEFSQVKKTINSYFPKNRNIPKSILAGLEYLFTDNVKENDTLIYIQKNHDNDLYVTPLLIKYDNKLKNITNGLYLEKHPTKKLKEEDDIIKELNTYFNNINLSKKLLSKFLQNGIKGIKQENIAFYLNNEIICLPNKKIVKKIQNRTTQIKELFKNKNLFKTNYIEIKDSNENNLINFEKLLDYQKNGFVLWKEHLPRLAMGNIPDKGYFRDFVLVDDNSKIIDKTIEIKNHFIIPTNTKELSFPLIFGEENINYEAFISSNELPFKQDVECSLKLTYNYEAETPYELTFIPLNEKIKPLKVKWRQIKNKKCDNLPIPSYPPKKSWEDFLQDPKKNGDGFSNLLEWILERLSLLNNIEKIPDFILEKELENYVFKEGEFIWGKKDKNGNFYCFVNVDGNEIFCHSSKFKENINITELYEGKKIYLKIKNENNKLVGYDIFFKKLTKKELITKISKQYREKPLKHRERKVIKALKSIYYPLLTVWNNHSLSDYDVPNEFREKIIFYINESINLLKQEEISIELKKEILFFLSNLHQDMPQSISYMLTNFSKNTDKYKSYNIQIALSFGNCELEWQQTILKNILSQINNISLLNLITNMLSIASWRSEKFIFNLLKFDIKHIILKLYEGLLYNFKYNNIKYLVKQLELLLAITRLRENKNDILCTSNSLTQKYITLIDEITKKYILNNIHIKTRIILKLNKPTNFQNTPDLLYALRLYLSGDDGASSIKIIGVSDE